MRPTLQDIGAAANVSPATVSRVLNGTANARISLATAQRVRAAAARLGYRPNPVARALVTGRRNMICLSVPYLGYPFAPQAMHFVQDEIHPSGWGVAIQGAESGVERYVADLTAIEPYVDGVIAVERSDYLHVYLEQRVSGRVPVVSAGVGCIKTVDYVQVDLARAVRDALHHLLEPGRRRVAYVVPAVSNWEGEVRQRVYAETMAKAGLPREIIVSPSNTSDTARESVAESIRLRGLPEALFCCNDVTALGAYQAVRRCGGTVPADCALVGCDGIEATWLPETPLSTIVQPIEAMCRTAVRFLVRRIEEPDLPQQTAVLEATLEVRGSSRA